MATKDNLFLKLSDRSEGTTTKVTVVGVGAVGMACAFSILTQGVSNELVLIDMAEDKAKGEMMDLQHGSLFMNNAIIDGSADYSLSAGSRVCIITAGVRQEEGESRLNLVQRNIDVMKHIVPPLAKYSPDSVIFVVSNPCDILTWVAWKLSGFPVHRVIGSGTNLDTSRFRYLLAKKFDVAPSSVHAYIIGEHGDSSVPVWSGVTIGGVSLRSINPDIGTEKDKENFSDIHKQVVDSAYEVIRLKGYTNWAIGVSVANVTNSLITNSHNIHCVSTLVKGMHGIEDEVYVSLPSVVGKNGISDVVNQTLTDTERAKLQQSAASLAEVIATIPL